MRDLDDFYLSERLESSLVLGITVHRSVGIATLRTQMGPARMIVIDVLAQDALRVSLAADDPAIETLTDRCSLRPRRTRSERLPPRFHHLAARPTLSNGEADEETLWIRPLDGRAPNASSPTRWTQLTQQNP